jgi:two-component sensor histidine kinase
MARRRTPKGAIRSIDLLLAACIALPLALFLLAAAETRVRLRHEAERESDRLVDVLHEHAQKVLETEALVLEQVEARITDLDMGRSDLELVQNFLAQTAERLPQIDAILVLDGAGRVRIASDPGLHASTDFARITAAAAAAAAPGTIVVTPPGPALTAEGPPVYALAHRDAASGGTTVITAAPLYFTAFWNALVPPDGSATLFLADGVVLARAPVLGKLGAGEPSVSPLRRVAAGAARGIYHATSSLDGIARTYAFRRADPWPLFLVVGIADRAVEGAWLRACAGYAALALLSSAALVAIALSIRRRAFAEAEFRAQLERAVDARTGELARGLDEKELLVREIHHRVKNNMQTIMSLLAIQGAAVGGPLQGQFRAAAQRIETMASLHKQLYQQDEIEGVDFGAYLERLVRNQIALAGAEDRIDVRIEAPLVRFALDLGTPLALIANEALSNALKHAFPDRRRGAVLVRLEVRGVRVTLTIEDDGVGSPATADDSADSGHELGQGLGMRLIRSFARSLRADVEVVDLAPGTRLVIAFDAPETSLHEVA